MGPREHLGEADPDLVYLECPSGAGGISCHRVGHLLSPAQTEVAVALAASRLLLVSL